MDAAAQLRALLAEHDVSVERLEPILSSWHALVEEAVVRLLSAGWRNRRIAQVKEKFGSLRILLDRTGETEAFLEAATCITVEIQERSESVSSGARHSAP